MRLLHLTTFLQGGAGLAIAELAASQARLGHDVAVVTSETGAPGYGNYPAYFDTLARANVTVLTIDSSFKRDIAQNLDVVHAVSALAGRDGFDLIHTHAATPSLIALLIAGRSPRRIPILQTMHGWGMAKSAGDALADVAILNAIDRVVVPAETSAALLRTLGVCRTPISVIPYGVADDAAPSPRVSDDLLDELRQWRVCGGTVLCCLGTIGARKNQHLVVDALKLIERRDRLRVVFVGDGDASGLRAHIRAADVGALVRFAGYRQDTRSFLAASDALVLPSLSEGQPLSILEAWREGLPVIVSDIPELSELVDDGVTGFLFDPRSAQALASAIWAAGRMTPAARLRLGARVRRVYETRFTSQQMVAGYLNEYAAAAPMVSNLAAPVGAR